MLRLAMLLTVLASFGIGCNDIPAPTLSALQHADQYELISLDPSYGTDSAVNRFHGYPVLGKTTIQDQATRKKMNAALRAAARENTDTAAACFNPRHGIHVRHAGNEYDLLICFQCLYVQVYENGKQTDGFKISDSPEPIFDDALRTAGVPLAAAP